MDRTNKQHFLENGVDVEYGLDVMYAEVVAEFNNMNASIKAIKDAAVTMFSSGSLVIAMMGAFQTFDRAVLPQNALAYKILTFSSLGLYVLLIITSVITILPIKITTPIDPEWDELHKAYWQKTKVFIIRKRMYSYINAIEQNQKIIRAHHKLVSASAAFLGLIIVCLLIARLLP